MKFRTIFLTLILSILFNTLALAEHLKGKSKAEKDGYLKARIIDTKYSGGLKKAYQDFANKAGTSSEMFFKTWYPSF